MTRKTEGGKGDKQRRAQVSDDTMKANWERIFNGMQGLHGDASQDGPEDGAGQVQETHPPTTGPRA